MLVDEAMVSSTVEYGSVVIVMVGGLFVCDDLMIIHKAMVSSAVEFGAVVMVLVGGPTVCGNEAME